MFLKSQYSKLQFIQELLAIKGINMKVSCNYCHEIILWVVKTFSSYIII